MPPLYKEGLFWLVLLTATAIVYVALMVFVGPLRATAAFGLLGLAGFQPLLYCKRAPTVLWDERDTLIAHRALIAGYSIFWLVFTVGAMGIWAGCFLRGSETISVHLLPAIVAAGAIVFWTARAIAIVVQYRLQEAGKGE